jgi:hypothetical protein
MLIELSPIRADARPEIARAGDALVIDGRTFDFADLPEGGSAETGSPWIVGPVRREGGRIRLVLLLAHGGEAPEETRFPAPLDDPPDGPLPLPPFDAPPEAA